MVKKLNIQPDEDFYLLGIVSNEKDYRLCYEINRWIGMAFSKQDDLEMLSGKQKLPSSFSRYFSPGENEGTDIFLLANKGSADFLVPEHKNIDFLILMKGNPVETDKTELLQKLKQLPCIQAVFILDADSLKSKENLIF